ncbi:MAG TPA: UDP-N-acetylmuramate--L-alanine ligase [Candidatus Bipolaricaulota bacterium]
MEKYHFIGIGGDGMSALAKVFWQQRRLLQGSNIESNGRTAELSRLGVPVAVGHAPGHLNDASTVVYSSAIPQDNVEMREARRRGLQIHHRQQALAQLANAQRTLGVAGTHGKTTTAVMVATLLKEAGRDPSYLLGAGCANLRGHAHWGQSGLLVLEVDESDGRFLGLYPELAVVTNIGLDHLNHYRDQKEIFESFKQYVAQSRQAVLCLDDAQCRLLHEAFPRALTYGTSSPADLVAEQVVQEDFKTRFSLRFRGRYLGEVHLPLPGMHNVHNAMAALLAGWHMGLDFETMMPLVARFQLPERRFEVLAKNGIMIVDDYAHLPEQIEVNLRAIRSNWKQGRIIALFQPHRFSRVQYLGERFGPAFAEADLVGVTDIYPAFESPLPGVGPQPIVAAVAMHAPQVRYLPRHEDVSDFLKQVVRPGDFVIGFGAGDLWRCLQRFAAPLPCRLKPAS